MAGADPFDSYGALTTAPGSPAAASSTSPQINLPVGIPGQSVLGQPASAGPPDNDPNPLPPGTQYSDFAPVVDMSSVKYDPTIPRGQPGSGYERLTPAPTVTAPATVPAAGATGTVASPVPTSAASGAKISSADPFDSYGALTADPQSAAVSAAAPAASAMPAVASVTPPDLLSGATDTAVHAFTLGADDVVQPAISATLNAALRPIFDSDATATWQQDYDRLQAQQRAEREAFAQTHPVVAALSGVAGGLGNAKMTNGLFGSAAPGASLPTQAVSFAKNVAAGAGLGGVAGFGMGQGGVDQRLQSAGTGAEIGGGLAIGLPAASSAFDAVAPAIKSALSVPAQILRSRSQEQAVSNTLGRAVDPATIQTSPVGPLDLAQATGSPAIAAKVDYAAGIPEGHAAAANIRGQQADAAQAQINKIGAPSTKADASAEYTNTLRAARNIAGKEETRVWTVPKLARTEVTETPVRDSVNQAVGSMDPVLQDSMPAQLKAIVNRLNRAPSPGTRTTMRDLNGIRSDLESIARNSLDGSERSMARTLSNAFMDGMDHVPEIAGAPNGIPTGRMTLQRGPDVRLPTGGIQRGTLREAPEMSDPIKPDPEISAAYKTARDYTRHMRGLFADPESARLLAKTEGVYRVDPSKGIDAFFNFSKGLPEGPRSISELSDFIGSLKAQSDSAAVSLALKESARSYVAKALSEASGLGAGHAFNPRGMQDFLNKNGIWIRNSGLFEQHQIDAAKDLLDYANLLRRPELLNTQGNSATNRRGEVAKTFIDKIMSPWMRHIGALAMPGVGAHVGGGMGGVLGAGAGMAFEHAVASAETAMRELMAGSVLDSRVAADLMREAPPNQKFLSLGTRELLRRLAILLPPEIATDTNGSSTKQPIEQRK